jgi:hypothetical protein
MRRVRVAKERLYSKKEKQKRNRNHKRRRGQLNTLEKQKGDSVN